MKKPKILLSGKKNLQHYADAVNGTGGIADGGICPRCATITMDWFCAAETILTPRIITKFSLPLRCQPL